jgi:hypothetical protein
MEEWSKPIENMLGPIFPVASFSVVGKRLSDSEGKDQSSVIAILGRLRGMVTTVLRHWKTLLRVK